MSYSFNSWETETSSMCLSRGLLWWETTHAMEPEVPRTGLGNYLSGKHRQHIHTALGAPRPGHGLEQGLGQCRDLAAKAVSYPGQHYWWEGCNSPRSTSHSGEEAPLHSLRGPNTGNITPNSDRDTGLGRSRLPGLTTAENWSAIPDGLVGPELKLDTDWVSESSSDTKLLQLSSSKASEATRMRENTSHIGSDSNLFP